MITPIAFLVTIWIARHPAPQPAVTAPVAPLPRAKIQPLGPPTHVQPWVSPAKDR